MIHLLDYDAGNLKSIKRALEFNDFQFKTIKKVQKISKKDIILIPGVGSFSSASVKIKNAGLNEIANLKKEDRPFLIGVCLGMQLLMSFGYEGGKSKGLNLIKGEVKPIFEIKPQDLKIPRTLIGWEEINVKQNISEYRWLNNYHKKCFYHVHSYLCIPDNSEHIISTYTNELSFIPNIIGDLENKVFGCQFHPEKSGESGLKFLKELINFALNN